MNQLFLKNGYPTIRRPDNYLGADLAKVGHDVNSSRYPVIAISSGCIGQSPGQAYRVRYDEMGIFYGTINVVVSRFEV